MEFSSLHFYLSPPECSVLGVAFGFLGEGSGFVGLSRLFFVVRAFIRAGFKAEHNTAGGWRCQVSCGRRLDFSPIPRHAESDQGFEAFWGYTHSELDTDAIRLAKYVQKVILSEKYKVEIRKDFCQGFGIVGQPIGYRQIRFLRVGVHNLLLLALKVGV